MRLGWTFWCPKFWPYKYGMYDLCPDIFSLQSLKNQKQNLKISDFQLQLSSVSAKDRKMSYLLLTLYRVLLVTPDKNAHFKLWANSEQLSAVFMVVGLNSSTLLSNTKKNQCDFDFGIYRLHISASLDPPDIHANLFVNAGGDA